MGYQSSTSIEREPVFDLVDGDGVFVEEVCDDLHANIHPLSAKRWDGVDNSCNVSIDEAFKASVIWILIEMDMTIRIPPCILVILLRTKYMSP